MALSQFLFCCGSLRIIYLIQTLKYHFFSLKTFSKALESTLESPQKELGLTPNGASDREREEQTWPPYTIGLKKPEKKCNLGKS